MKVRDILPCILESFDVNKAARTLKYSLVDGLKINKLPGVSVNKGADLVIDGNDSSGRLFVNYTFYLDDDGTLAPEITDSWIERDGRRETASYVDTKVIDWLAELVSIGRSNPKLLTLIRVGIEMSQHISGAR